MRLLLLLPLLLSACNAPCAHICAPNVSKRLALYSELTGAASAACLDKPVYETVNDATAGQKIMNESKCTYRTATVADGVPPGTSIRVCPSIGTTYEKLVGYKEDTACKRERTRAQKALDAAEY